MPVPKELDVFYGPHKYMKSLVQDVERTIENTMLTTYDEFSELLRHLSQRFHTFKTHEEIENLYILQPLLPRLEKSVKATLENDLHSSSRLNDILIKFDSGLQSSDNWFVLGEQLKTAIVEFTMDFIPHMNEEEEIFLPLLLKYFTEKELKELTLKVLELHHLRKESRDQTNFLNLPPEILIKILSYLSPVDLCRVSQVHPFLTDLAFCGQFWHSLHPIRWAKGHWHFFPPLSFIELNHERIAENNTIKESLTCDKSEDACTCICDTDLVNDSMESRIYEGLLKYLLPKIGRYVQTLDLSYSVVLTSSLACAIFDLCPNLSYLDVSNTCISDNSFINFYKGNRRSLRYIDLSGCSMIGDIALQRIAQACSPVCSCLQDGKNAKSTKTMLECLILAGCYLVTDNGLRAFTLCHGLPCLTYLELSGLPNISANVLLELVTVCPNLKSDCLFYCDNIEGGPYPMTANGCQDISGNGCCCHNDFKT